MCACACGGAGASEDNEWYGRKNETLHCVVFSLWALLDMFSPPAALRWPLSSPCALKQFPTRPAWIYNGNRNRHSRGWHQQLGDLLHTSGFIIDQAKFASSTMLVLWQLFFLFFLLRNNMDVKDTVRLRIGGYFLYSHGQETVDKPKKNHQRQSDTKYSNEISLFLHLGSCTVTFYI